MLDLGERGPLGLGLDHPGRLAMDEQQVINPPVRLVQCKFANRDPRADAQVQCILALNHPASCGHMLVDFHPGPRLASEVIMIIRPHEPSQYLPANQYDAKLLSILHAGTKRRAEAVSRACDHCVASVPFDLGEALTSN